MRIAFDARYVSDRYHGIGRYAYHLLEALTRRDVDRRYLVFFHPGYRNRRFDLAALGRRPNVELRPLPLPLYSPAEQLVWPVVLARAGATLFHSPYVALPVLTRTRLVMTVHDLIFERFPRYMPRRWMRVFYRAQMEVSVRRAVALLAVSAATAADIRMYYGAAASKVTVIGAAVDPSFRREDDPARLETVRARYRLPAEFILAVGAGRPHKNLETLVEAFAGLDPARAPGLVLAGEVDSRFKDRVAGRIRAHRLEGRVVRPGPIDEADLPALYSLARAFVFPSLVEGFGLPVLEAMACGTPVVASATPAVAEAAGGAALLFAPHDVAQLTALLASVLGDPELREHLRQRGAVNARDRSWDRVAQATLTAYGALA